MVEKAAGLGGFLAAEADNPLLRDRFFPRIAQRPFALGHAETLKIRLDRRSTGLERLGVDEFVAMTYQHVIGNGLVNASAIRVED